MNKFVFFLCFGATMLFGGIGLIAQSPFTPVPNSSSQDNVFIPWETTLPGVPAFTSGTLTLQQGDEIGAFSPSGLCVGKVAIPAAPGAINMVIQGSSTLPPAAGIGAGETILFRIWIATTNTVFVAGSAEFSPGGFATGTGAFQGNNTNHMLTTLANITVAPTISFSLNPADNICTGSTITLSATIGSGDPPTVLFESRSAATPTAVLNSTFASIQAPVSGGATPTTVSITVPFTERTIYRITATTGTFVEQFVSNIIQEGIVPNPVISGTNSTCVANSNAYSVENVAGNTYSWSISGGGTFAGANNTNTVNINWTEAGTHTITVTQGSVNGCPATNQFMVTVNALPAPVLAGTTAICIGTTATYSIPSVASSTYNWTVNGGTIIEGATTNQITVNWTTAGAGSVAVEETNAAGCVASTSQNVQVNSLPTPFFTIGATVCSGETTQYAVTPETGHTYQWSITGGVITGSSTEFAVDVAWGTPGAGTLTVVQTSAEGCSATSTANVTINETPAPAISGSADVCENGTGFTYSVADVAGATYNWTVNGGTITAGATSNQITVDWAGPSTTASVAVTQTVSGCAASTSLNVVVSLVSSVAISGTTSVITGAITQYSVPNFQGSTYNWTVVGGAITAGTSTNQITVQWGAAGAGTVGLAIDNAQCPSILPPTLNVTIEQLPQPTLAAPAANATGVLTTATLQWTSVEGAATYHVQIATEATFTTPVYDQSGIVATTVQPPAGTLQGNTIYYWRVASSTATASSGFTPANVFATLGGPVETMFLTVKGRIQGYWNTVSNTHVPTAVMVELWNDDGTFAPGNFLAPTFTTRAARATGVFATDVSNTTGSVTVGFANVASGDYWIVVRHGGNLSVLSASRVTVNDNATTTYDFSNGEAFSLAPQFGVPPEGVRQTSGVWQIISGDLDASNSINVQDVNIITAPGGSNGQTVPSIPPRQ